MLKIRADAVFEVFGNQRLETMSVDTVLQCFPHFNIAWERTLDDKTQTVQRL